MLEMLLKGLVKQADDREIGERSRMPPKSVACISSTFVPPFFVSSYVLLMSGDFCAGERCQMDLLSLSVYVTVRNERIHYMNPW